MPRAVREALAILRRASQGGDHEENVVGDLIAEMFEGEADSARDQEEDSEAQARVYKALYDCVCSHLPSVLLAILGAAEHATEVLALLACRFPSSMPLAVGHVGWIPRGGAWVQDWEPPTKRE
jgi:hypothetical protein